MLRRWTFFPLRNAETGSGTGTTTETGTSTAATGTVTGTETAITTATASVRPDWLPEDQWDATSGKPKADIAAALKSHQQAAERAGQVPADAAAYKVELPADLTLPEGVKFEVAENDPLLSAARTWAHQAGLTQDQFSGLMGLRAQMDAAAQEAAATAMQAEVQALGDKAAGRIDGATTFLRSKLPADQFDALKGAITTAKGVEAVETLMKLASGPQLPGSGGGPASESVSTEDYYKNLFNSK
ncbi:capsid assembly protein [Azospirillum argentinense]